MEICQIAQFLVIKLVVKTPRPGAIWFLIQIQKFWVFLHLGQGLSVLKCVLKSDNYCLIWGTLICIHVSLLEEKRDILD